MFGFVLNLKANVISAHTNEWMSFLIRVFSSFWYYICEYFVCITKAMNDSTQESSHDSLIKSPWSPHHSFNVIGKNDENWINLLK